MASASPVPSDGEGDKENVCTANNTINSKILQEIVTQIQRNYTRNRKVQIKLLNRINLHFYKISEMLEENDAVQCHVIEHIEELQNAMLETTKLCICLSEPFARIPEIYSTIYDLGSYFETIIIGAFTWCMNNRKLFGKFMGGFLTSLVKVSCDNPATWLYYVMISPSVLHILNAMFHDDHADFRSRWAQTSSDLMKSLPKAVFGCRDFGCQYYLLTVFHAWTQWIHSGLALITLNTAFSFVDPTARKQLLLSTDESENSIRNFLNSFNLSARGPKSVIPILCSYLFVGGCKLNMEEAFWVDFSVGSGRIHTFYSIPGTPLVSIAVRKDQIHSICLNWVVNDGKSQAEALESESQLETQSTASTFMKNERVLFFHIVLNEDFEEISRDIESLIGKKYRSVYLVFRNGDLVEKIMKEMNYSQHVCGSMNCQRPKKLRQMLASQNLSYTQSWCPESQVFGLDKSPLDGTRSFLNQTDPDSTFSRIHRLTSPGRVSITPGTSFCLDVSSAENTQSQTRDFEQTVSSNTSKNSFPIAPDAVHTPGAFYVSVTSVEEFVTSPEEANVTNDERMDITAATNDTLLEDPLPPRGRGKYGHLFKHAPFQKQSSFQEDVRVASPEPANSSEEQKRVSGSMDVKDPSIPTTQSESQTCKTRIRNSSPKPNAYIQVRSPPTPPVSEICSPTHRVFNATITDFEEDRESENETFQSSSITKYPFLVSGGESMRIDNDDIHDLSVINLSDTEPNVIQGSPSQHCGQGIPERSPTLSPVVGYSKTLLRRPLRSSVYTDQIDYVDDHENPSCDMSAKVKSATPVELSIISEGEVYWTPTPPSQNSMEHNSPSPKTRDQDNGNKSLMTPEKITDKRFTEHQLQIIESNPSVIDETQSERNSPHALEQSSSSSLEGQENTNASSNMSSAQVSNVKSALDQLRINDNTNASSNVSSAKVDNVKSALDQLRINEGEAGDVCWTPTPSQNSSPEMRDQENCEQSLMTPAKIANAKSIVSPSRISDSDRSIFSATPLEAYGERSPSLSPIIGYSRTLLRRSQTTPTTEKSPPPPQTSRQSPKLPCYAHAHKLRETTLTEKVKNPDYDPYDLWTCSEMEEYKEQVFPELKRKTYGRGKKPAWEHKINARKRKTSKPSASAVSRKKAPTATGNRMPAVSEATARKKKTPLQTIQTSAFKKKAAPGFHVLKLKFKKVGKGRD